MQIEIITIGDEVLSGRTLDTNFAFLARALERASVQVAWHSTVGDTGERIAEALTRALERADAVVATGGLGPTPDDVTRKTVADEKVLAHIRERARRSRRKLPASIENQALIPRGAETWENPLGTAPALCIVQRGKPVILLPGVPQEMERLATDYVVPYLRERSGRAVETFTLRTYGAFESQLQERIGALPQHWPGASLAYLPSFFGVDLRVTVSGTDLAQVQQVTGRAYDELRERVAAVLYGEGEQGLESVVGEALVQRGLTIATAESCTGGLLAKRLTDVPGSSRYFERGFVTYSNASKVALLGVTEGTLQAHGAVSVAVAEEMAAGARQRAGAGVGVSITGIAGPDGGTPQKPVGTVFIGVSVAAGTEVRGFQFLGTRAAIRERSAQTALDLVRRQLAGLPLAARLEESRS